MSTYVKITAAIGNLAVFGVLTWLTYFAVVAMIESALHDKAHLVTRGMPIPIGLSVCGTVFTAIWLISIIAKPQKKDG